MLPSWEPFWAMLSSVDGCVCLKKVQIICTRIIPFVPSSLSLTRSSSPFFFSVWLGVCHNEDISYWFGIKYHIVSLFHSFSFLFIHCSVLAPSTLLAPFSTHGSVNQLCLLYPGYYFIPSHSGVVQTSDTMYFTKPLTLSSIITAVVPADI